MEPQLDPIYSTEPGANPIPGENHREVKKLIGSAPGLLLHEADHRIGNSLQLVSTLLGLEERRLPDGPARRVLADARRRVAVVAALHRLLAVSNTADEIALDVYFQSLSDSLSRAFVDGRRLTLLINADPVTVPANIARGLGLIVNELVTNAVKHAFPQDQEGVIEIGCGLDEAGHIAVEVKDNGSGPTATNGANENAGLGMKMIEMLLSEMAGTIQTSAVGGRLAHHIRVPRV